MDFAPKMKPNGTFFLNKNYCFLKIDWNETRQICEISTAEARGIDTHANFDENISD